MAVYPGAAATDSDLYVAVNNLSTTLNGAINNSVTSITVASTTGFPAVGFITIDAEAIKYTSTSPTQFLGCTRGADGTTAASHADLTNVYHNVIAAHHNASKNEIEAVESDLVGRFATFMGFGRNRAINGGMDIDQANEGASLSVNSTADFFTADRWSASGVAAAGVFSIQQKTTTPPAGFQFYIRATVTTTDASPAAGSTYYIRQKIEGTLIRDFQTSTGFVATALSFWARSSVTGTYSGSIINQVGGSYPFTFALTANTWTKVTVIIPADTANASSNTDTSTSAQITIVLASGTSNLGTAGAWAVGSRFIGATGSANLMATNGATMDITGVQWEAGSVATAFEYISFTTLLQLCQRYYEKSYDLGTVPGTATGFGNGYINKAGSQTNTTTVNYGMTDFKVPKRATPTLSIWDVNGASGKILTRSTSGVDTSRTASISADGFNGAAVSQSVALDFAGFYHYTADARL